MLACALGVVSLSCIRYNRVRSEMSLEHFNLSFYNISLGAEVAIKNVLAA